MMSWQLLHCQTSVYKPRSLKTLYTKCQPHLSSVYLCPRVNPFYVEIFCSVYLYYITIMLYLSNKKCHPRPPLRGRTKFFHFTLLFFFFIFLPNRVMPPM